MFVVEAANFGIEVSPKLFGESSNNAVHWSYEFLSHFDFEATALELSSKNPMEKDLCQGCDCIFWVEYSIIQIFGRNQYEFFCYFEIRARHSAAVEYH